MNIILCFQYNQRKYVIFEKDSKVLLSCYNENKLTQIEEIDKQFLKDFIKSLCSSDFSKTKLIKEKNIIVCSRVLDLPDDIGDYITLDIGDKMGVFSANCASLYTVSKSSKKKPDYKPIIVILTIGLIFVIFLLNFKMPIKKDNSELLEKYTFVRDEKLADFYKMNVEIVDIKNKKSIDLFNDSYVNFENPYDGYKLIKSTSKKEGTGFDMNVYEGASIPAMATWFVEDMYDSNTDFYNTNIYTVEELEKQYGISVKDVFDRNKIKNDLDIMYNVILYYDKKVDSSSTEEEMIDKLVFEFYTPLVLPYYKENILGKTMFFTGDKKGYAFGTDNQIYIKLEHNGDEYRIIYEYDAVEQKKLNETDVINIVSSLKFVEK